MTIQAGKSGNRFTLNGAVVDPREFAGRNGFKFVNHVAAWARSKGGHHLDNARRYIEQAVVSLGCKWMRAPTELEFWGPPYFNHPDYPNETGLWNLRVGTGSAFRILELQKLIIRMYILLAREFDIVIQVPWLWTIKGRGDDDPREEVSVWNEHLLANVGRYLHELKTEGDGDGESRVDPGPLNLLSSMANEYRVHSDEFSDSQLRNMARRWKTRDNPGELISISQSQPKHEYWPHVGDDPQGMTHVELHPKRDGEWWKTGAELKRKFGQHLVNLDESMLYMTQEDWDEWIPKISKWVVLTTTNLGLYMEMHEDFWDHGLYSCFHDFESMGAGWHGGYHSSRLDEEIAARLGGPGPVPDRTLVFLNAYSEVETDGRAIAAAKEIGFDGLRRDVSWRLGDVELDRVVRQSRDEAGLWWLYLVGGNNPGRPDRPTVEQFAAHAEHVARAVQRNGSPQRILFNLGVEASITDGYKNDPRFYADSVNEAAKRIWHYLPRAKIIVTTTDESTREKLDYVRRLEGLLHPDIELSVHTYRVDKTPSDPSDGFRSREEEFQAVVQIAGDRELWNTETGWHTGEIRWGLCAISWLRWLAKLLGIKCSKRLNEEEVGRYLIEEIQLHEKYGARGFVVYQAFTGRGDTPGDLFGLLDRELNPKPRARILGDYLKSR